MWLFADASSGSADGTAVSLPGPAKNLFKHLHKLCRLWFLVFLILLLCVEVVDFSENESSKTNWKLVILHQEHRDCSSDIKKIFLYGCGLF